MQKQAAKQLLQDTFSRKFDENAFLNFIANVLKSYEQVAKLREGNYIREAYRGFIESYKVVGHFEDAESNEIDILQVTLLRTTSLDRARTAQRNFVADYLKKQKKEAALVAFIAPEESDWRFSLVRLDHSLEVSDGKIKTIEELTPARRWSFLVGENEGSHTVKSRFIDLLTHSELPNLSELENAFNIEVVTDEFFDKYVELFHRVRESLESLIDSDPDIAKDFQDKDISPVDFAKKTLGQMAFLYFLQKKGWFGVAPDQEWGTGRKNFLRELFERRHSYGKNFFDDILEPLFYEALAQDRGREAIYPRLNNCRMPFLNGGLFEPMRGYSWETTHILLDDEIFSNQNETKEGDIGDGILDVFDRYNFTVNENEPLEKEVAVDPEMLGKVFENLLEIKDRKSKGTFYTPREIVHYMCQEALINHLFNEMEESIPREDLETLVRTGSQILQNDCLVVGKGKEGAYKFLTPRSVRDRAYELDGFLEKIKVCDPAVGSGAFPLGMLTEIVNARQVLSIHLENNLSIYELKLHSIANSIHGVDIDPGAVEIAKLRLWLALVVEEEEPHPLPNLEHKIMQGNSLISMYENITLFDEALLEQNESQMVQLGMNFGSESDRKLERLKLVTEQFIHESQRSKKENLRDEISSLKWELIESTLEEQNQTQKLDEIRELRQKNIRPFFIWKLEFSEVFRERGGFDIVVGNPPYVDSEEMVKTMAEMREQCKKIYSSAVGNWDLFIVFIERAVSLLKNNGIQAFIVPNKLIGERYSERLRVLLQEDTSLLTLRDYSNVNVFSSVDVYPCVYILSKSNVNREVLFELMSSETEYEYSNLVPRNVFELDILWDKYFFPPKIVSLVNKLSMHPNLESQSVNIENAATVNEAYLVKNLIVEKPLNEQTFKMINTGLIDRYVSKWCSREMRYLKDVYDKPYVDTTELNDRRKEQSQSPKLIIAGMTRELEVYLDANGEYYAAKSTLIIQGDLKDLSFLCALLNSKLITFWYRVIFNSLSLSGGYLKINKACLSQIPIVMPSEPLYRELGDLVFQIAELRDRAAQEGETTLEDDTVSLEQRVDEIIFDLYELTEDERQLISEVN